MNHDVYLWLELKVESLGESVELDLTRLLYSGSIVMLCRNPTLNQGDFFDKTFEEYKNGFAANGNFVSTMLYQTMWRWIRQCNTLLDNYTLYQTMQHFVREWITLSENATLCQKIDSVSDDKFSEFGRQGDKILKIEMFKNWRIQITLV